MDKEAEGDESKKQVEEEATTNCKQCLQLKRLARCYYGGSFIRTGWQKWTTLLRFTLQWLFKSSDKHCSAKERAVGK